MKGSFFVTLTLAAMALPILRSQPAAPVSAQETQNSNVPRIPFDSVADFLKYSPDMDFYKMTLDGKFVGMLGESGRDIGQFNWTHGLACPSDDVLFVADMNNWRLQKLLHPQKAAAPGGAR